MLSLQPCRSVPFVLLFASTSTQYFTDRLSKESPNSVEFEATHSLSRDEDRGSSLPLYAQSQPFWWPFVRQRLSGSPATANSCQVWQSFPCSTQCSLEPFSTGKACFMVPLPVKPCGVFVLYFYLRPCRSCHAGRPAICHSGGLRRSQSQVVKTSKPTKASESLRKPFTVGPEERNNRRYQGKEGLNLFCSSFFEPFDLLYLLLISRLRNSRGLVVRGAMKWTATLCGQSLKVASDGRRWGGLAFRSCRCVVRPQLPRPMPMNIGLQPGC